MFRDADLLMQRWSDSDVPLALEYAKNFKLKDDPRVTPIGRFLRKSALDELPQLWNVLLGEMSLVGPRPYLPNLAPSAEFERTILSVSPGVTGPWQVRGRNHLSPVTRMQLDVEFASDVRFSKDLGYLLRTISTLINRDGV